MTIRKIFLGAAIALLPIIALAERLLPIDFIGQPQMMLKDGNISACGVRFVGVQTPEDLSDKSATAWASDASFMIYSNGASLVKGLITVTTVGEIAKGYKGAKDVPFEDFWIKANNYPATTPLKGKANNGETKNSKIYLTDTDNIMAIYTAVLKGESIKLGYKFKDGIKNVWTSPTSVDI